MLRRVRQFLDIRHGEGLPVLLSFLYVAFVVAAFLLAKPLRSSLYLTEYGPYALVYAYAAVPLALSAFVPIYALIAARIGSRRATIGTLAFFGLNVLVFWWAFRAGPVGYLPAVFYVWVNCFGAIAPVQAWSFANSLFDARQAKRLFGLVGAGASIGAVAGGVMARYLVAPVGGTVNLLLVLAALIFAASAIVAVAAKRVKRRSLPFRNRRAAPTLSAMLASVSSNRYLRLLAALVMLVAIATQWTQFQLSLVADQHFGGDKDALTRFFGTFTFVMGAVGFVVQLLLTAALLRWFGVAAGILILPLTLVFGSAVTFLFPVFLAVLLTNAADQSLRFSLDKSAYELLYLPIPPADRQGAKTAIDIMANRFADAAGSVVLGAATGGFLLLPGSGLHIRGIAAMTLLIALAWLMVAWRIRVAYVGAIGESIHRYRIDSERTAPIPVDQSIDALLVGKLSSQDPDDIRYALDALLRMKNPRTYPVLKPLLAHPAEDIRRDALAVLTGAGDRSARAEAERLLKDRNLGVRTQALLYLARDGGFDPLQRIEEQGNFDDFSIRSGMVAFLAAKGPAHNEDAARVLLERMAGSDDPRDRAEAARLLSVLADPPIRILIDLIDDVDTEVAQLAIRSACELKREECFDALLMALGRAEVADDAVTALSALGDAAVPLLGAALVDESLPLEVRREVPAPLVRIGTEAAQRALLGALLEADAPLRHRVIASLNKLKRRHPWIAPDSATVELLLAAEIAGHYRSYQVLIHVGNDAKVAAALRHAMEQELERIFRLIGLLSPGALHDAYVGVRAANSLIRANALEYLENVLRPELRAVLLPLIDSQVSETERAARAEELVGAPLTTSEEAVATLLASADPWLRSRVEIAARRVAEQPEEAEHAPAPSSMDASMGAG